MKDLFTKSPHFKEEYCCSIVRIGEVVPIEGSDFLATTLVNGIQVVVRKDMVKTGDVMFYAMHETALNRSFLAINNLFEWSEKESNVNYPEVKKLIAEGKSDEAKRLVGYFNKHGRVRMIKLKGQYSQGFLFGIDSMLNWMPQLKDVNLEELVGTDFDTVGKELFLEVYIPKRTERTKRSSNNKRDKKLKKFDKIIEGTFHYHYDTGMLAKNIHIFKPDDVVAISVKMHGTSIILGNIPVRVPKKINIFKKLWNLCLPKESPRRVLDYTIGYDLITSSRNVIRNQFIIERDVNTFYDHDVWLEYREKMLPYIPKDTFVYGEIFGYTPDGAKMYQQNYDYGCAPGESRLMPYRIVTKLPNGYDYEWNVTEVRDWTDRMIAAFPELKSVLYPIPVLFHGKLKDLYPDIEIDEHWNDNLLARMKGDKKLLGMESNEPLCRTKVPREGICLRLDNDPIKEAYKLKSMAFINMESKLVDAGQIDMEMEQDVI